MPYIVHADAPSPFANKGWDFAGNHFPRKIHYKKAANKLAEEAERKG
jgi:hypothetical protein